MAVEFPSPPPTDYDPRGFAVGMLSNRELERQGLRLTQWRWFYGPEVRQRPFDEHERMDGRFMRKDGTLQGWWPGDHKGCRCSVRPVYRREREPEHRLEAS